MTSHRHQLSFVEKGTMLFSTCYASGCLSHGEPFLVAGGDGDPGPGNFSSPDNKIRENLTTEQRVELLETEMKSLQERVRILSESFQEALRVLSGNVL